MDQRPLVARSPPGTDDLPWSALEGEIDPEWRIYGRSASDDQGPIVAMLAAQGGASDEG